LIIVRSPLRITLGGGGTDIPAYYEKYGGCCVAAAIDKYVYVTLTRPFFSGIYLKYSELEHVDHVQDIKHSRIREAMRLHATDERIELTTLADIPAGTGLGSSSSFTTALVRALSVHYGLNLDTPTLADDACEIEIYRLREPIGKQDQYISAYGGVRSLYFGTGNRVHMESIRNTVGLEENLMLFFTGITRSTTDILRPRREMLKDSMGETAQALLEAGRLRDFGSLLNVQWKRKKDMMPEAIPPVIEEYREVGLKNGAIGGKLVGAGGGGFLLFYTEERSRLRAAMAKCGLEEVRFRFEFEGTKVLVS
jgi:D-glycero-alpha-D-manno-heptose-7-phosphate kinase